MRREITVSVIGTLVGSLLIWAANRYISLGIAWSICIALAIVLLATIIIAYIRIKRKPSVLESLKFAGISEVNPGPNEEVEGMFNSATYSIDFWGVSANRTARSHSAQEAMRKVADNKGKIRFLLLNPESAYLEQRALDENEAPSSWRNDITSTLRRLKKLKTESDLPIDVRLYDAYPIWRVVIIDNKSLNVHWFLPKKPGHHSPELILLTTRDGLDIPIKRSFEETWRNSVEPNI
jgi:hypothetical protein